MDIINIEFSNSNICFSIQFPRKLYGIKNNASSESRFASWEKTKLVNFCKFCFWSFPHIGKNQNWYHQAFSAHLRSKIDNMSLAATSLINIEKKFNLQFENSIMHLTCYSIFGYHKYWILKQQYMLFHTVSEETVRN